MPQEETSYFEKCVGALPPEKRDAARAAFREIADTGEDSYLSKLLAVLEANNAYAKAIPMELAAVHEKFLAELGREARRIREEQHTVETSRNAELQALLHREVQQLDKTLPLTHAIDAVREQNRQIEQLRPAILRRPPQFDVLLGGIIAGTIFGAVIGAAAVRMEFGPKLRRAAEAQEFLDYAHSAGINLRIEPKANGNHLTISGPAAARDARWSRDAKGNVVGAELEFPEPVPFASKARR